MAVLEHVIYHQLNATGHCIDVVPRELDRICLQELLISGTVRDLSERKKGKQKLQAILESAPDTMVVVNEHREIIIANSQVERSFGYERIGQPIEILVPERFRAGHPEKFNDFARAPVQRPIRPGLKLFRQHKDGTEFPVEISLSPAATEDGRLFLSTIRDVSRLSMGRLFCGVISPGLCFCLQLSA